MPTRVTAGYCALMGVLGASLFLLPGLGPYNWAAIGLLSVSAVLAGTRRYAAARPLPWRMLAGALLASAVGDTIFGVTVHSGTDILPLPADLAYLLMFPLITIGMIQMARSNVVIEWSRVIDVLVFTCAAALLAWVYLVAPTLSAAQLDSLDRSTMGAYTLGDLVVLILSVRLVIAARRSPAIILLAIGALAVLVADVTYTLIQMSGGWRPGDADDLLYFVFYATWGAAALQPSMAHLTVPMPTRYAQLPMRWAALLGLSLAVPPVVLLVESLQGEVHDLAVIAITSVLMSALVITRLAMALAKHRRAVARERALREACSRLVGAASAVEVSVAVREAVGELVPPGLNHLAIVAIYDLTAPEAADPVAGIMIRYPLPSASHRRTRLLSTRTLHPDLRDQLAGYPATLACTLVANRSEALDPGLGALLVAADSRVLNAIQDSVEVLAAQATMALERIALTDMVNRNDNDRYLRTVTQGSVDVVLIVDDDQHIRYASPSLGGMLGGEAPMFATLRDIVAAGEHEQIDRTLRASQRSTQPEGARDWWHLPRLDGTALSVEVNCRDLRQDRMVRGFVITLRDVTDEDSRQRDLIQRALHASPAGRNRRASRRRFN